jgi:hypothetical protein
LDCFLGLGEGPDQWIGQPEPRDEERIRRWSEPIGNSPIQGIREDSWVRREKKEKLVL